MCDPAASVAVGAVFYFVVFVLVVIATYKALEKAGLALGWALLSFFPGLNIIPLLVLGFAEWPNAGTTNQPQWFSNAK